MMRREVFLLQVMLQKSKDMQVWLLLRRTGLQLTVIPVHGP